MYVYIERQILYYQNKRMKTPQEEVAAFPGQLWWDEEPSLSTQALTQLSRLTCQGQVRKKRRVVRCWDKTKSKVTLNPTPQKAFCRFFVFQTCVYQTGIKVPCSTTWVWQHRTESRNAAARISAMLLLIHNCRFPFYLPFPQREEARKKKTLNYSFLDTTASEIYISVVLWEIFRFYTVIVSVSSCKVPRHLIIELFFI